MALENNAFYYPRIVAKYFLKMFSIAKFCLKKAKVMELNGSRCRSYLYHFLAWVTYLLIASFTVRIKRYYI